MNIQLSEKTDIDVLLSQAYSALANAKGLAETWRFRKEAKACKEAAKVLKRRDLEIEMAELIARAEWKVAEMNPPASRKETGRGHKKLAFQEGDFILPQKTIRNIRESLPESESDFEAGLSAARQKKVPATRAFFKERKAQKRIEDAARRKATKEARPKLKDVRLYSLPIADLEKELEPESVDVVFTDPPYDKAGLSSKVYEQLAAFAGKVLKPGGHLVSLAGNMFLPDVLKQVTIDKRLTWNFMCSLSYSGGPTARINAVKAFAAAKPVLWMIKPPFRDDQEYIRNLTEAPNVQESPAGSFHKWSQNPAAMLKLLKPFAYPGETVVDPFCGGGGLALAAHRRGCKVVASDIDPESVKITSGRLAAAAEAEKKSA